METTSLFQRLRLVRIWRLLMIISVVIIVAALFQCFALPYGKRWSLLPVDAGSVVMLVSNATILNNLGPSPNNFSNIRSNDTYSSDKAEEFGDENETKDNDMDVVDDPLKSSVMAHELSANNSSAGGTVEKIENGLTFNRVETNTAGIMPVELAGIHVKKREKMDTELRSSGLSLPQNITSAQNVTKIDKIQNLINDTISSLKRQRRPPLITRMNAVLLQSHDSSHYLTPQWSYVRDRELRSAKLKIESASIVRSHPGLHGSAFRNVSRFIRSYELMERMLRVYIYKEGEKPIFHQSKMRGIYASEGWFMKLLEGNKKFVVRDPKKAHLFYLPFSPQMLRTELFGQKFKSQKDLEGYLKNYVDLIAHKYSFWNRTGGADHFLVGCHDWAARITRQHMRHCIRVLCNANVAKGFQIGKDTTLPATYIRSAENPLKDLGGKSPTERPNLAFFAGGMHGYLRPILLKFWENKEPDMKIFGPMPRDIEGKQLYREYMKSSKYCICARGHEVYSPRIVEAIFYECVPVIISDNYVPPFFEVLNWEEFSIFVEEKDVPKLRNILVSIPEEKYVRMQVNVKMVQQHFLWHKIPVKYDLFHMILHSVWYNRIFQIQS